MRTVFLLLFLLLITQAHIIVGGEISSNPQSSTRDIAHTFTLNIAFIGYDQEVVDTNLIDSNIKKIYDFIYGNYSLNYTFSANYHFANSSYYMALKEFVLANSVNGTDTTSALNITALQIQRSTGTKMSIFLPQSGRAINASAVEEWFVEYPIITDSTPSYWFYVLNFTEFDSSDHNLEHWYNATELDYEANTSRSSWRLEWDNNLNPDVGFPYACFTSNSRVFFIDPSAFQWYLTWARIWWGLSVSGPKYDYYYEDLDEFQMTNDVGTSQGKTDLAYYLAGWIEDALSNLLAPYLWTDIDTSNANSISIQALILNNASANSYSIEDIDWIIDPSLVEDALGDLAPFTNVEVTVKFRNLSDIPQLEAIFDNAAIEKRDGWTYYDGFQIWDDLYMVRGYYFNFSAADIVINGYVYLEKNMSMFVYGGEYTGLGGGGQILVMKEIGRYFQEDGISPKSGLGSTFIHEAGHNLGFPHTFTHGAAYAGDFAFDVMGYYPYSFFFTQLRKDCFRRLIVDFKILALRELLYEDLVLYERKNSTVILDQKFHQVELEINETLQFYDDLQFLQAYSHVAQAASMETSLRDLIWIYLCDLNDDGLISIYDIVKIATAYGSHPGDDNWNQQADLQQDDVIDIFDIVIAASNYDRSWQQSQCESAGN